MRNVIAGLAVLGLLATGTRSAATAYSLSAPRAVTQPPAALHIHWDGCGPRCWEHRRWEREREWERHRWAQHRRWEDSRRYPSAYGYAPHY